MDIYNIQGFVLRTVDYGETSKIVTVLSKDYGFISVMAKGVKSPKSKKLNLIALYTESIFELNKKGDMYYLKDGIIIDSNSNLKNKIDKIYLTQLFFDIIERTTFENYSDNVYMLLKKSLYYLSKTDKDVRIASAFLIKYISMIGFKPILRYTTDSYSHNFSLKEGRIVPESSHDNTKVKLRSVEIDYLTKLLFEVFENISKIEIDIEEKNIFKLITSFINYNLGISMPQSYQNYLKIKGIE